VSGIRDAGREFQSPEIELLGTPEHGFTRNGKLGSSTEVKKLRRGLAEELLMEPAGGKLPSPGILAPRDKEPPPAGIVGLIHKSKPTEAIQRLAPVGKFPQAFVKVRGVVKGMSLGEDGHPGERVVAFHQMGQIGMRLPPLVWQLPDAYSLPQWNIRRERGASPFVKDCHAEH
jgi:hypothetical protein